MLSDNNNSVFKNSLVFSSGVITGLLVSYYYHNSKNSEKRYTKTHYNIIINSKDNNELLESYYIDYESKKIYFQKNLENVDVIFYTTNAEVPIYIKKNFTGDSFDLQFK